jgi:ubiquinone/menaquinone biosynthesis C-methylase UbiE
MTITADTEYLHHWDWLAPFWDVSLPEMEAEEAFLREEIGKKTGATVLDIACGTGRLPIRLAEAGHRVTGLDFSPAMLDHARQKIAVLPLEIQGRIELVEGDMRAFSMGRRFDVVNISWSFIYMLTPDDQRQALTCMHDHLEEGGRLIFSMPDPKLESIPSNLSFSTVPRRTDAFVRPDNGHRVLVWVSTEYSIEHQTVDLLTFYEELDEEGRVIAKTYKPLTMRFTFRQEMQYLLELCGFSVEALYGDHQRGPFRPGGAQIWVARTRGPGPRT